MCCLFLGAISAVRHMENPWVVGGWGCQDSGMAGGVLPMGFLQASRGIYGPRKKIPGSSN